MIVLRSYDVQESSGDDFNGVRAASLWSLICAYGDRSLLNRTNHMVAHTVAIGTAIGLIVRADSMTSLSCLFLAGAVMILVRNDG